MNLSRFIAQAGCLSLRSHRLLSGTSIGDRLSSRLGRGMEFDRLRPYTIGDDIRHIDWNVTARSSVPYVKVFREERQQQVFFIHDVSKSFQFGSNATSKSEKAFEVTATLAFAAMREADAVGGLLFAEQVVWHSRALLGGSAVQRLLQAVQKNPPYGSQSNLNFALRQLVKLAKIQSRVVIVSDFYCPIPTTQLIQVGRRYHTTAILVRDAAETTLSDVGLLALQDLESRQYTVIDTHDHHTRMALINQRQHHDQQLFSAFRLSNIDWVNVQVDRPLLPALRSAFNKRSPHYR